jgi:hypothetical protein
VVPLPATHRTEHRGETVSFLLHRADMPRHPAIPACTCQSLCVAVLLCCRC